MRLLLTGATGFLGRHVAAAATDWTVTRVTRSLTASSPDEVALGPSPWTQADFAATLLMARPDVVLHCAGVTHATDVRACLDTNAVLAAELLTAVAGMSEPPRIILVGSAAEYGIVPEDNQPVVETYPCAPRTDYAVAKYAQTLSGLAAAMRGQQVLVARLFNPVGVGMPSGLALPSFARRIAGLKPGSVMRVGDLSARRDFLDVDEAARLLLALASMPYWPWPVVNVCSGRAYRLGDLLDGLIAASGARVGIEPDPALMRPDDMPILTGSTERLRSVQLTPVSPDFTVLLPRLLAEARALIQGT
nr:NAD-dependent epimerase/dehydratase family protein [uncultured Rhodopila sp.]